MFTEKYKQKEKENKRTLSSSFQTKDKEFRLQDRDCFKVPMDLRSHRPSPSKTGTFYNPL